MNDFVVIFDGELSVIFNNSFVNPTRIDVVKSLMDDGFDEESIERMSFFKVDRVTFEILKAAVNRYHISKSDFNINDDHGAILLLEKIIELYGQRF